jgi:hypothetical protein
MSSKVGAALPAWAVRLMAELDAAEETAKELVTGLTPEQLNWQPGLRHADFGCRGRSGQDLGDAEVGIICRPKGPLKAKSDSSSTPAPPPLRIGSKNASRLINEDGCWEARGRKLP